MLDRSKRLQPTMKKNAMFSSTVYTSYSSCAEEKTGNSAEFLREKMVGESFSFLIEWASNVIVRALRMRQKKFPLLACFSCFLQTVQHTRLCGGTNRPMSVEYTHKVSVVDLPSQGMHLQAGCLSCIIVLGNNMNGVTTGLHIWICSEWWVKFSSHAQYYS